MIHLHFVSTLLCICVGYCAGVAVANDTVLCATPATKVPCPEILCDRCLTISQYALNNVSYFTASAKLVFLKGEHNLTENFTLQGGENFTVLILEGKLHQSRILFGKHVVFTVLGLQSLAIKSLELLDNSNFIIKSITAIRVLSVYLSGTGYSFEDIDQLKALNLTVSNASNNISSALLNIHESNAQFTNLNVVKNSGKLVVLINQSSIQFTGIFFEGNAAVDSSSLTIISSNATFEGMIQFYMNSCENNGGALSAVNSTVTFHHQTDFIANTARKSGGAINVKYSTVTFSGFLTATNNSNSQEFTIDTLFGGFMNSFWSNVTITGRAVFENNYIDSISLCLGGAIGARMSTLVLSGSVQFHSNYVKCLSSHGGAIVLVNSILSAVDIHFVFSNNLASTGGAIALMGDSVNYNEFVNNTLHIRGTSLLEANQATNIGGAIYGEGPFNVNFTGNTSLVHSNATSFGSHIALSFTVKSIASFNGRTELKHAYSTSPTVSISEDVQVSFCGETIIENNTVLDHTGVLVSTNGAYYQFVGRTIFRGNKGIAFVLLQESSDQPLLFGEALFLENDIGISVVSSTAHVEGDFRYMNNYGPCVIIADSSEVTFNGTMVFESNSADSGPAINSIGSTVFMYSDNTFYNNSARYDGGSVYLIDSYFYLNADHKFIANSANRGGAVYAINSNVHLNGDFIFTRNHAKSGGVFALGVYTVLHLNNLNVSFANNVAKEGGIIYVEDVFNSIDCSDDYAVPVPKATSVRPKCFYSVEKDSDVSIMHRENVAATDKGNILFGGNLMRCVNEGASVHFQRLFGLQIANVHAQNISSNPYQIVLCTRDNAALSNSLRTLPGKLFSISVVGLDQLSQPISSVIRAQLPVQLNYTSRLGQFQSKQTANGTCTSLNYRVYTQAQSLKLTLYAEGPCNVEGTASLSVTVQLGDCPDGFQLAHDACTCTSDLLKYSSVCDVDDESILNDGDFWAKGLYDNGSYIGVITFPHCPFDYCRQMSVYFTLMDPDPQCAQNRSGVICGRCRVNYSLTLGGGGCAVCPTSPSITFALLLSFATLGIALVALLTLLRLTVVYGTLNGLIFYANIVGSNKDIFKIQGWANVFISWLNLDFGFTVCFYDGMDMYAHTWMQFLFPFYIWTLIGIIIVTSHYSAWMTRRLGSNPVAVLATLIFLSYAKLLRTIITVFYYANLELPHGQTTRVWLYDGNIAYLKDKHLPLFIFALIFFVFIFIPYSLLLLLGPWLQAIPSDKFGESVRKARVRKLFVGWYNDYRIQSFMAAYTAPYNSGYRFWTGVFLLLRCVLFLVFASNSLGVPSTNVLAIAIVTLATLVFTRLLKGRVYKCWWVDTLEALFLLNLGVLSATTFYTMSTGGKQLTLAHTSVGISLILLVIILLFHMRKQITSTRVYKSIGQKLIRKSILSKFPLTRKFEWDLDDEANTEQVSPLLGDSTAEEELQPPVAPTTYISIPSSTPLIQN